MLADNLVEIILLVVGLITGWMLTSKRSQGPTREAIIEAHEEIKEEIEATKTAKIKAAEEEHTTTIKSAKAEEKRIQRLNLESLADLVRKTFDK